MSPSDCSLALYSKRWKRLSFISSYVFNWLFCILGSITDLIYMSYWRDIERFEHISRTWCACLFFLWYTIFRAAEYFYFICSKLPILNAPSRFQWYANRLYLRDRKQVSPVIRTYIPCYADLKWSSTRCGLCGKQSIYICEMLYVHITLKVVNYLLFKNLLLFSVVM
jgi:hypothetical protein